MLRDIAVARVKQMLGFKQNLDTQIIQAMIEVQEDLERERELPFFLRSNYTMNTVANTKSLNVPTNFIREWDDDQLFVTNEKGVEKPVVKDQEGFLRLRWPVIEGPGLPIRYARVARQFHFYPTPDRIYPLNGHYYAKDLPLSTNIQNKWLEELPFIIISRAGMAIASGLRDQAGIALFSQMNEAMSMKLHQMTTADDMAGTRLVIGGSED